MSSQRTPRHRVAPMRRSATRRRSALIAAASLLCALFALALATLPAHNSRHDGNSHTGAADGSARFGRIEDQSMIAPRPRTASPLRSQPPPTTERSSESLSVWPRASSSGLPASGGMARAVFDAINTSRQHANLPPLAWSARLATSAHMHDEAMASSNTLSHQTSAEADLGTRVSDAGVSWWWVGENIGVSGTLTLQAALALESAMVNEKPPDDGHRRNILMQDADAVGVDVLLDRTHHRLWLTEDFAQTR
jgi:uncharacterized protein YkwD